MRTVPYSMSSISSPSFVEYDNRIKFIDISLIEDLTKEIKKLKADNEQIEKRIAEIRNISSDNINLQEQADIVLNIIESYFTTFDELDLVTRRNLLRVLISNVKSDGTDLELNLIGVRDDSVRDNVPLCEDSKCNHHIMDYFKRKIFLDNDEYAEIKMSDSSSRSLGKIPSRKFFSKSDISSIVSNLLKFE